MWLHGTHPEVARSAGRQDIAQRERAEIGGEARTYRVGKACAVFNRKIRPPIYGYKVHGAHETCFRIGCHQNEFLL